MLKKEKSDKIKKVYLQTGSLRKTSEVLNISVNTVRRYINPSNTSGKCLPSIKRKVDHLDAKIIHEDQSQDIACKDLKELKVLKDLKDLDLNKDLKAIKNKEFNREVNKYKNTVILKNLDTIIQNITESFTDPSFYENVSPYQLAVMTGIFLDKKIQLENTSKTASQVKNVIFQFFDTDKMNEILTRNKKYKRMIDITPSV